MEGAQPASAGAATNIVSVNRAALIRTTRVKLMSAMMSSFIVVPVACTGALVVPWNFTFRDWLVSFRGLCTHRGTVLTKSHASRRTFS